MSTESILPFQMTAKGACAYLMMSKATLYLNIKAGLIPSFMQGHRRMFLRSELERFSLRSAGVA